MRHLRLLGAGPYLHCFKTLGFTRGRDAVLSAATDAYVLLTAADGDEPIQPDHLERLATAAYLFHRPDNIATLASPSSHSTVACSLTRLANEL